MGLSGGRAFREEELSPKGIQLAEQLIYASFLLSVVYAVKFRGWRMPSLPGLEDYAWLAVFELGLAALPLRPLAAAIATLGFLVLWLDAVLFRVFTIELGPGEVGTAITSSLYQELFGMDSARRFFKSRAAFTLLPLAAALLHLRPWTSARFATAMLASYGAWTLISIPEVSWVGLVPFVGWLALRLQAPRFAVWEVAGALGCLGLLSIRRPASRVFRPFFMPVRLKGSAHFKVRDEDSSLLNLHPAIPRPSESHGLLRGANVVYHLAGQPGVRYGLTTMCAGLGMGGTVLWENLNA